MKFLQDQSRGRGERRKRAVERGTTKPTKKTVLFQSKSQRAHLEF